MFSMCSELTPRARIPDTRIPQFMQPWSQCCQNNLAIVVQTTPHIFYLYFEEITSTLALFFVRLCSIFWGMLTWIFKGQYIFQWNWTHQKNKYKLHRPMYFNRLGLHTSSNVPCHKPVGFCETKNTMKNNWKVSSLQFITWSGGRCIALGMPEFLL